MESLQLRSSSSFKPSHDAGPGGFGPGGLGPGGFGPGGFGPGGFGPGGFGPGGFGPGGFGPGGFGPGGFGPGGFGPGGFGPGPGGGAKALSPAPDEGQPHEVGQSFCNSLSVLQPSFIYLFMYSWHHDCVSAGLLHLPKSSLFSQHVLGQYSSIPFPLSLSMPQ